mgnify:CR=1 FL=1
MEIVIQRLLYYIKANTDWWDKLSSLEQKSYLIKHKHSKLKVKFVDKGHFGELHLKQDNKNIGYAELHNETYENKNDTVNIGYFSLTKNSRGKGLGYYLLHQIDKNIKNINPKAKYIGANPMNKKAF